SDKSQETHLYVCTHAARDCRCGETGGAVFRALLAEVAGRKREDVKVREISHVGGHVWAGNVLSYPVGDWYGKITPADVPKLLDAVLSRTIWGEKWRGRGFLAPAEQAALLASAPSQPRPLAPLPARAKQDTSDRAYNVPLTFELWDGRRVRTQASLGESLMELCRALAEEGERAFDAVEGVCGGNLECATCHVYLLPPGVPLPSSPPPLGAAGGGEIEEAPPVPAMSEAEEDMLAYGIGVREGLSRLGCQIRVTRELGEWCERGGRVGVPRF
ncbi:hypothetical protein CALVIDRAFT_467097, partial [Calocera viscosa TUFC12733]